MSSALRQEAIVVTYQDVEQLITSIAGRFHKQYGGDLDDWISEGKLVFFRSYWKYDGERGARFSSWLYTKLRFHFCNLRLNRKQDGFNEVSRVGEKQSTKFITKESIFQERMERMSKHISSEALEVMNLIIQMPQELASAIEASTDMRPQTVRKHLRHYLSKRLGWSICRIRKTFVELAEIF